MTLPIHSPPIRGAHFRTRSDSETREAWPLVACTALMPVMYLLGLHGLVWAAPGVVLTVRLMRQPTTRIPRSVMLLGVALAWMLVSVVQVKLGGTPLFAYRWCLFLGAFAAEVWLVNKSTDELPTQRVAKWLGSLWVFLVIMGWAAILSPVDMPSPLLMVAGPIGNIDFFESISAWRFAEVQGFLGFPLPRPAAPFPGANGWGSATGLLFPIFLQVWIVDAIGRRRVLGMVILAAAIVPIIYSFNRGLWMSIVLALAYLAIRRSLIGKVGTLLVVTAVGVAAMLALTLSPLGDLANQKVETAGDSNDSRSEVYEEAIEGAKASPLIGHGAPERIREDLPPIGTHGMLWYLLFVHGFVVAILYVGWLAIEIIRSAPSRAPGSIWFHLALVAAGLQTLVYGMLPQVVLVGMIAGLARRETMRHRRELESRTSASARIAMHSEP